MQNFGHGGVGMLDPAAEARRRQLEKDEEHRRAILAEQAEPQSQGFGRNLLSQGLVPLLAGLATGGAAVPMALAFGLGAASLKTQAEKGRDRENRLREADERYAMSRANVQMFDPQVSAGARSTAAEREYAQLVGIFGEQEAARLWQTKYGGLPRAKAPNTVSFRGPDGREQLFIFEPTPNPNAPQAYIMDPATMQRWPATQEQVQRFMPGIQRQMPQGGPQMPQEGPGMGQEGPISGPNSGDPGMGGATPQGAPIAQPTGPVMQPQAQPQVPSPGVAPQQPVPGAGGSQFQRGAPPSSGAGGSPFVGQSTSEAAYDAEAARRAAEIDRPTPPSGWRVNDDGSFSPIPGSPEEREIQRARQAAIAYAKRVAPKMMRDIDRALELADAAGPWAGLLARPEGENVSLARGAAARMSPAFPLQQALDSVASNIGIEELQSIRDRSPTGGALGQVPFRQQQRLEALRGLLQSDLPPEVLRENLAAVYNDYVEVLAEAMWGSDEDLREAVMDGEATEAQAEAWRQERERTKQEMLMGSGYDEWGRRQGGEVGVRGGEGADPLEGLSPRARQLLEEVSR